VLIKSRLVALHVIVRLLLSFIMLFTALNPRSQPALLGDRVLKATSKLYLLCFFQQLPSIE